MRRDSKVLKFISYDIPYLQTYAMKVLQPEQELAMAVIEQAVWDFFNRPKYVSRQETIRFLTGKNAMSKFWYGIAGISRFSTPEELERAYNERKSRKTDKASGLRHRERAEAPDLSYASA